MMKYQESNGWSHRDLRRLSHPNPATPKHRDLFSWACSQGEKEEAAIQGFKQLQAMQALEQEISPKDASQLIMSINSHEKLFLQTF